MTPRRESCPTCGHLREVFDGKDGTSGFVPPRREFANIEQYPGNDDVWGVYVGYGGFRMAMGRKFEAERKAHELNVAHSHAVSAYKARVLEAIRGMSADPHDYVCIDDALKAVEEVPTCL